MDEETLNDDAGQQSEAALQEQWITAQEQPETPVAVPEAQPEAPTEAAAVPAEEVTYTAAQYAELQRQIDERNEWAQATQLLAERGITPDQFQQQLTQRMQAPQTTEQEAFSEWLTAEGFLDLDELTLAEQRSLLGTFRQEQFQAQQQAQYQAATEQAQAAELKAAWTTDLTTLQAAHPEFGNPNLREMLLNTFEGRYGTQPNAEQLTTLATEMLGTIKTFTQAEVAKYATGKQQDAAVPVVAGGSAPSPVAQPKNWHAMNATEQTELMESHLAASFAPN